MFTAWVQKGERMFLGNQFNWKKYSRCHLMPQATNYVLSYMDLPVAEPAAETWCHGKNTKLRVRTFERASLAASCNFCDRRQVIQLLRAWISS